MRSVLQLYVPTDDDQCAARREDRHHLEQELRKAQVVALVYSIDDPQSFDRMAEYWLPMIRQLGVNVRCR